MTSLLTYEFKVAVALLVFYLFYRFLLKKETFHRFNRVVLVGTAVLSFLLPFCIITVHKPVEVASLPSTPSMIDAGLPEVMGVEAPMATSTAPWWPTVLAIVFWAGVAIVLLRVLLSILCIYRIVRHGEVVREEDGCRIIVTDRDIDPFSWMKYIVLSRKDWEGDCAPILAHEKAHIGFRHSVEILLVDVLSALQWFNPAIWMLRADLQELHEYEADDTVLRGGANIREYQYLLIRKAVSKSGYSVANSFNHSILKNRITMMSKSRSPLARGLRVLYVLPLVCLGIGLQARTVYVPVDKDSEKIVSDANLQDGNKYASFNGNFADWVQNHLVIPKDCMLEGKIMVSFTVDEQGKVGDVRVMRGLSEELDKMVVDVISKSPDWTPGMKDGKPVKTTLMQNVPIGKGSTKMPDDPNTIVLNVSADGTMETGGKTLTFGQLRDIVTPQTTVMITAEPDVKMGVINEVREMLRGTMAHIRYTLPSGLGSVLPSPLKYEMPAQKGYVVPVPIIRRPAAEEGKVVALPKEERKNVCVAYLNDSDKIFFENNAYQDDAEIIRRGKNFLLSHGRAGSFELRCHRGTSFGAYIHLELLLLQIISAAQDEKAQSVYGRSYQELSTEEKNEIHQLVPAIITEAEMRGRS